MGIVGILDGYPARYRSIDDAHPVEPSGNVVGVQRLDEVEMPAMPTEFLQYFPHEVLLHRRECRRKVVE